MLGKEKKELLLLLQFRICKLYIYTNANTALLSQLTGMPLASVKRAIKVLDNEFDKCVELLPIAQLNALNNQLITQIDDVSEASLTSLRDELIERRTEQNKNKKLEDLDEYLNDAIIIYIEETRQLQDKNNKRLIYPTAVAAEMKKMLDEGYNISTIGENFGLSKSTVSFNCEKVGGRKK